MHVSKGVVEEFWRNKDVASLEEEAGPYGQLIPGAPEISGNPWDLLPVIWPSP